MITYEAKLGMNFVVLRPRAFGMKALLNLMYDRLKAFDRCEISLASLARDLVFSLDSLGGLDGGWKEAFAKEVSFLKSVISVDEANVAEVSEKAGLILLLSISIKDVLSIN